MSQDSSKLEPNISIELFPPKTKDGIVNLKSSIKIMAQYKPKYFSVTYGAGGSTKDLTFEIVKYIKEHTNITPVAHLTCVDAKKDEIISVAKNYLDIGVNKILALRGDPPGMEGKYEPHPSGYYWASDLITALLENGDFDISIAAFPEKHPEAESLELDIQNLLRKQNAGAKRAICQYCFDNEVIIEFIKKARDAGVTIPIIPGVVIINNFNMVLKFSQKCGASVPKWVQDKFKNLDPKSESHQMAAVDLAVNQCQQLMQSGINDFHFYSLNNAVITGAVCKKLRAG